MTPSLSVWLDLWRVVAALAVVLGHAVALDLGPPGFSRAWHRSADDAVVAFFVISGFVIAYTTERRHHDVRHYVLARASRIYSVAVPVLLAVLLVDAIGMRLDPTYYAVDWQYPRWWLHLPFHWLFLGETWLGSAQPFSNQPYWSLAYEVWYYVLFGVLSLARGAWRWALGALVLAFVGPGILLLAPLWWLGVVLYRCLPRWRVSRGAGHVLMLAAVTGYAWLVLSGQRAPLDALSRSLYAAVGRWVPGGFDPGPMVFLWASCLVAVLFAAFLVGANSAAWTFPGRAVAWIRALAGYTFTLYLLHYPLLLLAKAAGVRTPGWAGFALLLALVLLGTWLLAQVGERRQALYRAVLDGLLTRIGWRGASRVPPA